MRSGWDSPTFVAAFYYSRKQMQKLSTDIETKILIDVNEKMNDLTKIAVEKPQLTQSAILSLTYQKK
jgi:hypothetical protein